MDFLNMSRGDLSREKIKQAYEMLLKEPITLDWKKLNTMQRKHLLVCVANVNFTTTTKLIEQEGINLEVDGYVE